MHFFYQSGLLLYLLAIKLSALLGNNKASLWLKGREKWSEKLQAAIPKNKDIYWFHTASLGEFEQARPLIEKIKAQQPSIFILLSFFSPSGYEVRKDYQYADYIFYLPLDTRKNARQIVSVIQPKQVLFVKYEFWFNLLEALHKRNISTVLVSGIFRPKQHFFQWYGSWFRHKLEAFHHFYVQNETSKNLLNKIGFYDVSVVGDTRFDRVAEIAKEPFEDGRFSSFSQNNKVIVFGSSWAEENDFAVFLANKLPTYKIMIAPHELNAEKIKLLKDRFSKKVVLYSETKENQDLSDARIFIVDTIGLLSKIYRYAYLSVVGGGFGSGIHNILETAVYGNPIIIGPNYRKFQEAVDLVESGGAFSFTDYKNATKELINNEEKIKESSIITKSYVHTQLGATVQILKDLFQKNS